MKYEGIRLSGIAAADTAVAPRATASGAAATTPFIVRGDYELLSL